jgi:hypothetical protein
MKKQLKTARFNSLKDRLSEYKQKLAPINTKAYGSC